MKLRIKFQKFVSYLQQATWSDYDLQRVEILNKTAGKIVDFNFRSKRYNKTTYTIAGEITYHPERIKEHEVRAELDRQILAKFI